jgi:hypothetical protein
MTMKLVGTWEAAEGGGRWMGHGSGIVRCGELAAEEAVLYFSLRWKEADLVEQFPHYSII